MSFKQTNTSGMYGRYGMGSALLAGLLSAALVGCGTPTATTETTVTQAQASEESAETGEVDATSAAQATDGTTSDTTDDTYYQTASAFSIDTSDLFSKRDLDPSYKAADAVSVTLSQDGTEANGSGVEVDGSTVTITAAGTYVLTGSLTDGRVVVDVDDSDKVQLVFDGVELTSSTGTALYVRNADKVFLTLADGSKNSVVSTGESTEEDDHTLDGAVFATDDLTINGAGQLTVSSEKGSGIVAKDELTLVSGTLEVTAAKHALEAKDSVAVKDGSYTLKAQKDGIHVEHSTNGKKGFAYFAGGSFVIEAGTDGVDASNDIVVDGGTFTIAAGDDGMHSDYDLIVNDGTIDVSQSYEGMEGARYEQNGGEVTVVASDDGVNACGEPTAEKVAQKEAQKSAGQGGQEPIQGEPSTAQDGQATEGDEGNDAGTATDMEPPANGDGQAPQAEGQDTQVPEGMEPPSGDAGQVPEGMEPPEGVEGERPQMDGGRGPRAGMPGQDIGQGQDGSAADGTAQDQPTDAQPTDGDPEAQINDTQTSEGAPGGMGMRGQGGPGMGDMGGGMMDADETASITINGGKLVVEAGGDGLDSNGALVVNGGETYVSGPTSNGDGSLDCGTTCTVNGGVLLAAGSSGMAETFGSDSTQGSMLVSASGKAGDLIELKDADGTVLASFTTTKEYSCIVATAPGVETGKTYTLSYGDQSTEVTLDSISYSNVQSMMGGGMGGGRGMGNMGSDSNQALQTQPDLSQSSGIEAEQAA